MKALLKETISNLYNDTLIHDKVFIGSVLLCDRYEGTGSADIKILGTYGLGLIGGVFDGLTIPNGYHKEYRMIASVTTGGDLFVKFRLNNIYSSQVSTWSANSFRQMSVTPFFKESDVVLEPTYLYEGTPGTNLGIVASGNYVGWAIYGITLNGYLARD